MRISDWSSDVCSSDLRSIQKIWPAARYRRPDSGRLSELDPNTRRIARLEFVTGIELFRILVELEVILLDLAKQVGCVGVKSQIVVQIVGDVHVDILRRSEEHTSELQSLMRISYAVFCLKKKRDKISQTK